MKILIIRFSSIGDIVLTTPVIRCIKTQEKAAEIHFLVKEKYLHVVQNNPYIDKIHVLNENLNTEISELKNEKFDMVIDLHHNIRSWKVTNALKKPYRRFYKINREKWLMVNFKLNLLPSKHIVDRYFEALSLPGVANDNAGLDYFVTKSDEEKANQVLAETGRPFLAWVIGGTYFTKKYPEDKIAFLIRNMDIPVVLLGGSEDAESAERIRALAGYKGLNLCGKISLNESAAVIQKAHKVLTNDTGLMHIAAACKKDIFVFWGNTIPQFGMEPYLTEHVNGEVKYLKCRPCTKLGYKKCPRGHFNCMNEIDLYSVLEWIKS